MIQQPDRNTSDAADIDFVHAEEDAFLDVLPMHGAMDPASSKQGTTPGVSPSLRTSAVLGCSPAPILPACRLPPT